MKSTSWILTESTENGVTKIILNRTDRHNAFNQEMISKLTTEIEYAIKDPKCKIIILRANGENFSAGADINWMQTMTSATEDANKSDAMCLAHLMHTLYFSPKPTLAIVQGKAFGGGVGLAACCQLVVAQTDAQFCFPEARLGIFPAVIAPFIINAIGSRWARYYFLTTEIFDAKTAFELGLCHKISNKSQIDDCLKDLLTLLLNNGPCALKNINQLVNKLNPTVIDERVLAFTADLIAKARVSEEGQIGLNAFLKKQKPSWTEHLPKDKPQN